MPHHPGCFRTQALFYFDIIFIFIHLLLMYICESNLTSSFVLEARVFNYIYLFLFINLCIYFYYLHLYVVFGK